MQLNMSLRLSHRIAVLGVAGTIGLITLGGIYFMGEASVARYRSAADQAQSLFRLAGQVLTNSLLARRAEKDFLGALRDLGGGQALRSLDLNAPATVTADGRSVPGRVVKLSPGFALFAGALTAAPGAPLELRIDGIDRPLPGRFVEAGDGGVYLQLPLNHEHLTYMERALNQLGIKAAA